MTVGVLFILNIGAIEAFINLFMDGGKVFDAETYGLAHLPAILDWGDVFSTGLYALGMSALCPLSRPGGPPARIRSAP
jgi:lipoprotein-releasing system permease protein